MSVDLGPNGDGPPKNPAAGRSFMFTVRYEF